MRPILLVLAVLVAATAAPTALASPSALTMELPEGPIGPDAIVPVNVTLVIQDFMCHEPREFTVQLIANSTLGVKATFARTSLVFTTPAHTYFSEEYRQTQTVNLTVRAVEAGQVELTASFGPHANGPCLVPDGFTPSSTTVVDDVLAPDPNAPTPDPAVNSTADGNATNESVSPTPRSGSPTPRGPTCAPDGGCGLISEYEPPQESADNDTPAAGLVATLAVLTFLALARRRKS